MKCPKCSYVSFDYLEACKRCGQALGDLRTRLQIIAVSPEDRAPPAPVAAGGDSSPAAAPLEPVSTSATEEVLGNLDFEESFDGLVEPTRHGDGSGPAKGKGKDKDDLLDLDFGDIFSDEGKKG